MHRTLRKIPLSEKKKYAWVHGIQTELIIMYQFQSPDIFGTKKSELVIALDPVKFAFYKKSISLRKKKKYTWVVHGIQLELIANLEVQIFLEKMNKKIRTRECIRSSEVRILQKIPLSLKKRSTHE